MKLIRSNAYYSSLLCHMQYDLVLKKRVLVKLTAWTI